MCVNVRAPSFRPSLPQPTHSHSMAENEMKCLDDKWHSSRKTLPMLACRARTSARYCSSHVHDVKHEEGDETGEGDGVGGRVEGPQGALGLTALFCIRVNHAEDHIRDSLTWCWRPVQHMRLLFFL